MSVMNKGDKVTWSRAGKHNGERGEVISTTKKTFTIRWENGLQGTFTDSDTVPLIGKIK